MKQRHANERTCVRYVGVRFCVCDCTTLCMNVCACIRRVSMYEYLHECVCIMRVFVSVYSCVRVCVCVCVLWVFECGVSSVRLSLAVCLWVAGLHICADNISEGERHT